MRLALPTVKKLTNLDIPGRCNENRWQRHHLVYSSGHLLLFSSAYGIVFRQASSYVDSRKSNAFKMYYNRVAATVTPALHFRIPNKGVALIQQGLLQTFCVLWSIELYHALDLHLIHTGVQPCPFVINIFNTGPLVRQECRQA